MLNNNDGDSNNNSYFVIIYKTSRRSLFLPIFILFKCMKALLKGLFFSFFYLAIKTNGRKEERGDSR